jgi:hypothetical protein
LDPGRVGEGGRRRERERERKEEGGRNTHLEELQEDGHIVLQQRNDQREIRPVSQNVNRVYGVLQIHGNFFVEGHL